MNENFEQISFNEYMKQSAELITETINYIKAEKISEAISMIEDNFIQNKSLFICGNGGSAADANHIHAELVGRFERNRRALNVISLNSNPAFITAWSNDIDYESIFSRQLEAFPDDSGVLLVLSTSGNSKNIIDVAKIAKTKGIKVISLTGKGGGMLKTLSDILIDVPSNKTAKIQQVHECIYHYICGKLEYIR